MLLHHYAIESYWTSLKAQPNVMLNVGTLILLYFIILTVYGITDHLFLPIKVIRRPQTKRKKDLIQIQVSSGDTIKCWSYCKVYLAAACLRNVELPLGLFLCRTNHAKPIRQLKLTELIWQNVDISQFQVTNSELFGTIGRVKFILGEQHHHLRSQL